MTKLFEKLLADFLKLPKVDNSPTYLEITKVGADRFEERCSQVLMFFLNPRAEHNLRGLVLDSLLECINQAELRYENSDVKVFSEEMTEDRKRIDITVLTSDFVIAIENKIGAKLYNPLESYVKHINLAYQNQQKYFVVLSVRKINTVHELDKMTENKYLYVNYSQLFDSIKRKIGYYAIDGAPTYLTFLFDFIKTIEKMYNTNNKEIEKFFYSNSEHIQNLITEYDRFKRSIKQKQIDQIQLIKVQVEARTAVGKWRVWQGWDLVCSFNDDGNMIGIECFFSDESIEKPIGSFHPYITVWNKNHWYPYEEALREKFPECEIDMTAGNGERVDLQLPVIESIDPNIIAEKLVEYYIFMSELTERFR